MLPVIPYICGRIYQRFRLNFFDAFRDSRSARVAPGFSVAYPEYD